MGTFTIFLLRVKTCRVNSVSVVVNCNMQFLHFHPLDSASRLFFFVLEILKRKKLKNNIIIRPTWERKKAILNNQIKNRERSTSTWERKKAIQNQTSQPCISKSSMWMIIFQMHSAITD